MENAEKEVCTIKTYKDSVKTNLHQGGDVSKSSGIVEAIGTIDELNAFAGMAKTKITDNEIRELLAQIQHDLFRAGADLATPLGRDVKSKRLAPEDVKRLEDIIAKCESGLEPLKSFILPGGTEASASLHMCRTVCRRAERVLAGLNEQGEINPEAFRYVNRLSDVFFALARLANRRAGVEEESWTHEK